jgi:nitrile hydratase accessory protein
MTGPPTFAAPWEARAFAMVRLLRDRGVVSASEWTAALSEQVGDEMAEVEYRHWLAALERVLTEKGLVSHGELQRNHAAWGRAALRTPHGEPIVLDVNDFHE